MTENSAHPKRPIRLLVVEDSAITREFLLYLFASDQEIRVIGTAANGEEALEVVRREKPDVITMDLHMPKMDGYTATRAIMERCPTPIVVVTGSSTQNEMAATLQALEAGALAVLKRPAGLGRPDHAATARELIQTVKLMSEIKVVKRWAKDLNRPGEVAMAVPSAIEPTEVAGRDVQIIAIGSSTGGPLVLQQILAKLPRPFPVPLVIVQHIAEGFTEGLAHWLRESSGFPTCIASHGQRVMPGWAYVAPNGYQLAVDAYRRIVLREGPKENGHCPSVSCLFRSVAAHFGPHAIGILLTGMGKDGAAELALMRSKGAFTIAQDKQSSVVHGMPGEAIRLGAAIRVLPPDQIVSTLSALAQSA